MPCNCENDETTDINVEILDATGAYYKGILYAGLGDFTSWFESKAATFHVEVHSKVITGNEFVYSAHSLPMLGVTLKLATDFEDIPDMVINLEKDNSYLTLTKTGQRYELGS